MINSLGIKINMEEASVLLASADTNRDDKLFVDEFIDMICSKNDTLNVDLNRVSGQERILDSGKSE